MFWEILVLILTFLLALTAYNKYYSQTYFQKYGMKNLKPQFPFVGNMLKIFRKQVNITELLDECYDAFPEEKYIGHYEFTNRLIIMKDVELLKEVAVKDFENFTNHRNFIPADLEPLLGGHLLMLEDQKWKDMRNTLSPAFTGSKMRGMFTFIQEYSKKYVDFYKKKISQQPENDILEIELKEAYGTYATDIIGTCAFGIDINSLENPTNEFFAMAKSLSNFSLKQFFVTICYSSVPKIMKFLKFRLMSEKGLNFFRNLVQGAMKTREEKNIVRHDMIHLLMEAKKGSLSFEASSSLDDAGFATVEESDIGKGSNKTKWTDDQLTAQVFLFLVAGFDTTSTLLSFLTYEIVKQPEIQKKIQEEIDEIRGQLENGELTYNDLQKLKYMDMVVSETLRYWPPGAITDRKVSKDYKLPPANENAKPYQLQTGDGIWIPIKSIHHDPKYYEDPEKFDPERFSDENKHKIQPYTYLPFGVGPRNCIGSRFALMEIKAILFHILSNFDFVRISKTQIPMILKKGSLRMEPEHGHWVGMKLRSL